MRPGEWASEKKKNYPSLMASTTESRENRMHIPNINTTKPLNDTVKWTGAQSAISAKFPVMLRTRQAGAH